MNKLKVLSTLLFAGAFAISAQQGAYAALSASQTVTATLGTTRAVVTYGGNITSTIDDAGSLVTAFTPGFEIMTNSAASQALTLKATVVSSDAGVQDAFFGNGTADYIVLANDTIKPTAAAITDAKATTPVETANPNCIAYSVNNPSNIGGQLTYTWNVGGKYWDMTLTHKGDTYTSLTIPAGAARPLTYSGDDEAGAYKATITMSFV